MKEHGLQLNHKMSTRIKKHRHKLALSERQKYELSKDYEKENLPKMVEDVRKYLMVSLR